MRKGTKIYSITRMKCPKCHEGKFFLSHPYNLFKAGDTYERCPVCEEKYSKEPGFYYGAMYVAYGLGVANFVGSYLAVYLLNPEAPTSTYIWTIVISLILLTPLYYALSKIIWANMFISYWGNKVPKGTQKV